MFPSLRSSSSILWSTSKARKYFLIWNQKFKKNGKSILLRYFFFYLSFSSLLITMIQTKNQINSNEKQNIFHLLLCDSYDVYPYQIQMQGGSMPNTSSSVPFLLSSSMQSIRSRRTSTCLSSGPLGSGSGLLQQLGSGMVRQLNFGSGTASPVHQAQYNGNAVGPGARFNYVRKCPSLNITFSNWY